MPDKDQEELIRILTKQVQTLKDEIAEKQAQLRLKEGLLAAETMPFAGKNLQQSIVLLLREYNQPTDESEVVNEAVVRGAAFGTKHPSGNVRKSLLRMKQARIVLATKDGKLYLSE